ncbi:hypothetical protein RB597_000131 [Gaeumannomyces tritici]
MPKNKGKGGKNRRRGKNENDKEKRELDTIDLEDAEQEDLEYAQIITAYGGCKFDAVCYRPTSEAKTDWGSEKRVLHVRGKLRKKQWVNVGDIVICSKREFEPAKGDIIQKYTSDQARELKAERMLPFPPCLSGRQQDPTIADHGSAIPLQATFPPTSRSTLPTRVVTSVEMTRESSLVPTTTPARKRAQQTSGRSTSTTFEGVVYEPNLISAWLSPWNPPSVRKGLTERCSWNLPREARPRRPRRCHSQSAHSFRVYLALLVRLCGHWMALVPGLDIRGRKCA